MSVVTDGAVNVSVGINEVVYVNIDGLSIPARRIITEIRIDQNGIFITGTNTRTGEKTVWKDTDINKKFFVDIHAAETAMKYNLNKGG